MVLRVSPSSCVTTNSDGLDTHSTASGSRRTTCCASAFLPPASRAASRAAAAVAVVKGAVATLACVTLGETAPLLPSTPAPPPLAPLLGIPAEAAAAEAAIAAAWPRLGSNGRGDGTPASSSASISKQLGPAESPKIKMAANPE